MTSIARTARTARIFRTAVAALALALALSGVPAAIAREGRGVAGTSGTAGPRRAPIVALQPPGALPGIDVSHWQGAIDWAQVAASGQRFAIGKATEGRTHVDPTYATNKAAAVANGIVFGAYHFARPDATPGDAILEADHFVDTAQLQPGDLIPVLDLERTGGLSEAEVTAWILAWLGRVTERLGVRPMVYTSPNGWAQRTGDTTAVVDAGYTILWVAHWGVETPRLPANGWGGYGWTFWQYTDCGSVPGVEGCVDLDWLAHDGFASVTIPFPDQTPPTATIAPPNGLARPVTVSFSEVVRGVTTDNVVLYRGDPPAYGDLFLTCSSGKGVDVDCRTGNVRVVIAQPAGPLIPGETYRAAVNPPGAASLVVDRSGNPAPATTLDVSAPTELEQSSAGITYAWRSVADRDAIGGSYVTERSGGATATFAFSGRAVTWHTMVGPDQGRASVWIDGERVGTFDQYAARRAFGVTRSFAKLPRGTHTIAVRVLGIGSAATSDTLVAIDGFEVARATRDLGFSWGAVRTPGASGGSLVASDVKRASLELTFRGTGIEWTTARGPDQGKAAVYVDGTLVRTVDNYARVPTFDVVRTVSGLAAGVHVLRIVVLGEARPKATGALVSVDRFSVVP